MVPDSRLGLQQVKESKTIGGSEDGTICEHLLQPNNVLTVVGNGALSTHVVYIYQTTRNGLPSGISTCTVSKGHWRCLF